MVGFLSRQYATATSPDAVERFVTSWLLPPSVLFVWRALISFYAFIVIFIVLGHDSSRAAGRSFSYFTVLGYWGLAFYFGVSAAHTWAYRRHGKAWLQNWPSWLQYAHSVFYSTVTTFPPVVTSMSFSPQAVLRFSHRLVSNGSTNASRIVVFWSVLSYGALSSEFTTWANISQHGLNSAFAVSEVIISRANPSPWINLVPVLVLLGCYLAVAEITHATEGWYVYIFLDPYVYMPHHTDFDES